MESYFSPLLERHTEVEATPYSKDAWNVVRCKATRFVYLANPPAYAELASDFAWEKTSQQETKRRRREEPIVSQLSLWAIQLKTLLFPKRNKISSLVCKCLITRDKDRPLQVLDIGCGRGTLLKTVSEKLAECGHAVCPLGIEVSPGLAELASKQVEDVGGEIIVSNAVDGAEQLPEGKVDVVIMSCFLEHERQPSRLLKSLHNKLSDDGIVVIKVPNYDSWNRRIRGRRWCGFRYPDHVNYFTPATLAILAKEADYEIARQNFVDRLPMSDNMYAVLKKRS